MRRVEQVMGLPVSVDVRDETPSVLAGVDRLFHWLSEADARFSPFLPDSEVSRIDEGGELSAEMAEILALCEQYERSSGGAFRARLPGRGFDPCGVVKGWAVQRAAELLKAAGASRFCLNAGGDVVVVGEPPWRVGIRHPELPQEVCAVLALTNAAVATSADYERGAHILDGRTGLPASGLLSLTVVAADLTTADATATAAYAMGPDGIAWAADQPGCLVFAVDEQRRVYRSPGLQLGQ